MPLLFTELVKLSDSASIMLYKGINGAGNEFFAYIKCSKDKAKLMYSDYENKISRQLFFYGVPIYKDFLSEPDEKAKEFLKRYLAENS